MAGRAAWAPDPARYYDLATYQAATAPFVGADYPGQAWSYPPTILLLAAPFGLLPYLAALAVWLTISAGLMLAALRAWLPDRSLIAAALLAPAAIFGVISGQFMFAAVAILLTVMRWRERRPWLAGLLLGLLTLKPQLGLFFPILLLATRNWRMIGGALITTLALALATALIWGPEVWTAYLGTGIATQSRVLSDPEVLGAPYMPTIFMNLRSAGASLGLAQAVQLGFSLLAAAIIAWRFWKRPPADDHHANALFFACAVFGTPYLLSYDTLALAVFTLLASPPGKTGRLLQLLVFVLPLIQIVAGQAHVPGPALIPAALAFYLAKLAASSIWVDQRNCPTGRTHSSR